MTYLNSRSTDKNPPTNLEKVWGQIAGILAYLRKNVWKSSTVFFVLAFLVGCQRHNTVSAAEQKLYSASKEYTVTLKTIQDEAAKTQSELAKQQQALQPKIAEATNTLRAELKKDNKYKKDLDLIDSLQQQQSDLQTQANADFQKRMKKEIDQLQTDKETIVALTPVVRNEQHRPDTDLYNVETQKFQAGAKK